MFTRHLTRLRDALEDVALRRMSPLWTLWCRAVAADIERLTSRVDALESRADADLALADRRYLVAVLAELGAIMPDVAPTLANVEAGIRSLAERARQAVTALTGDR